MILHGKEFVRTLRRIQKYFISDYRRTMDKEYCVVWIAKKDMEVLINLLETSINLEVMNTAACELKEEEGTT